MGSELSYLRAIEFAKDKIAEKISSRDRINAKPALLSLPQEIRDMIYTYVLPSPKYYKVSVPPHIPTVSFATRLAFDFRATISRNRRTILIPFPLMLVCIQLYNELYPKFYRSNSFVVYPQTRVWVKPTQRLPVHHIQRIYINCIVSGGMDEMRRKLIEPETLAVWLKFTRRLKAVKVVCWSMVHSNQNLWVLARPSGGKEYLELLQQDRLAWEAILSDDNHGNHNGEKRSVRRIFGVGHLANYITMNQNSTYEWQLRTLRTAFGNDVVFVLCVPNYQQDGARNKLFADFVV